MDHKPSWSLLKLPNELLGRIVSLCNDQDERHRERMQSLSYRDVDCSLLEAWATRGRSLNKFSLTCKRVRALCCPLLFSTVTSKAGINVDFRRRIAPSLSLHLRRIELASSSSLKGTLDNYADLLISISTIPSIESLKLDSRHLDCLFVESRTHSKLDQLLADDSDTSLALRLLIGRITTLELGTVDSHRLAAILSRTNNSLTSLSLAHCGAHVSNDTLDAKQLQEYLARFKKLEQLSIKLSVNIFRFIDITTSTVYPLRSLTLYHSHVDVLHIEFIACFASTLESLSYESDQDQYDPIPSFSLLSTPFPRLKSLTVTDSSDLYFATSPALTPSLVSLNITTSAAFFPRMASFLPGHLSSIPSIQYLDIGVANDDRLRQPRQALLQALSETKIKLHFTTPQDLLLADEEEVVERGESVEQTPVNEYIGRRKAEVKEVLDFGTKYQEQLVTTGDTVGMDRLVEALRPLKMLQDFQEDD